MNKLIKDELQRMIVLVVLLVVGIWFIYIAQSSVTANFVDTLK